VRYVRPLDPNAFKPAQFHSLRLADASTGLESCICIVTRVPPGTGTTSGLHVHPVNQVYYVLEGAMRMQLGTDTFTVRPGQMVVIPKGTPHWNWNDDDADERGGGIKLTAEGPVSELSDRTWEGSIVWSDCSRR